MKLKEGINKAAKVWEDLVGQLKADKFKESIKLAFAEHKQILEGLENQIIIDELSEESYMGHSVFMDDLSEFKEELKNLIKKDYEEVENDQMNEEIENKLRDLDVQLEKLNRVKLPKEVKYEVKETQTDNIKLNASNNQKLTSKEPFSNPISRLERVNTMYNSSASLLSENESEKEAEDTTKDYSANKTLDLSIDNNNENTLLRSSNEDIGSKYLKDHLNKVAKNIVKDCKFPIKYKNPSISKITDHI